MNIERIKEVFEEEKYLKPVMILFIIVTIFTLGIAIFKSTKTKDYNSIKIDSQKELVYEVNQPDTDNNKIPYINIDTEEIREINKNIENDYIAFMTSAENIYTYTANQSEKYLSVLIVRSKKDISYNGIEVSFKTYVIDLSQKKILNDNEIKNAFSVTNNTVEEKIKNKLEEYYEKVVEEGYVVPGECDYNCFLNLRNIDNYIENIEYYIESEKLYVYKTFDIYSIYGEEEFFGYDDFKFLIE